MDKVNEKINEKLSQIPDTILNSFTKRAIRDAEKIIDVNDDKFEDLCYSLYRAYCIGFIFGNVAK